MGFNTAGPLAVSLAASLLAGCAANSAAVFETAKTLVMRPAMNTAPALNPDFEYLRVVVQGRQVFVAKGYVDAHPDGPVDVWYSSEREVIRLQNGRVAGATGMTTEWRRVDLNGAPGWQAANASAAIRWQRGRDVMPGYRAGLVDEVITSRTAAPSKTNLIGTDADTLVWFEERVSETSELPPARYAVDFTRKPETVVYAEQCLSMNLCFSWQRWSAVPRASAQ